MATTFDTRPLTRPVTKAETSEFRRAMLRSGEAGWRPNTAGAVAVVALFAVVLPTVITANVAFRAGWSLRTSLLLWAALSVGVVVVAVLRRGRGGNHWVRLLRAWEFARANGMRFSPQSADPPYQGAIFGLGRDRRVLEHVWSTDGPVADCGRYRYTTGSGKESKVHQWQFAAIRLEGPLPHMLLDARANNTFMGSNLPTSFDRDQRISLGGEFDRHFDLYAPDQYGHDAFYVFTPDLMAHLIDETHAFDVEFVDDWMFLYTRYDLSVAEPATWERLARISDTVTARMRDRSRTYRDLRVADQAQAPLPPGMVAHAPVHAPHAIAPQGRRLRRKRYWLPTALIVGGWFAFQALRSWLDR
ncbi:hypothetical protein [Auraticoccus monumenti]|uniref:DUF3137 domain-containing protein n=1 Tax=Auraticoccus monumenti TaxID=675864 RepID=A0A1G6YSP4_9ACTN|nr:hypothetical protein [Auraticoccus monumenti]SDD93429.1 hypothetical protein SAMN04489747_2089 [Auraticoccus monumenti]